MSQSAIYSELQAQHANLNLASLGLTSWNMEEIKALQKKIGVKPVDGWFGPKSIEAWKAWNRVMNPCPCPPKNTKDQAVPGHAILDGVNYRPPTGLVFFNHLEKNGIPAELSDTSERKTTVTQFVLHRGAQNLGRNDGGNYARATERVLDAQGLSTTFSMDVDGAIYQHFDPAIRRGRHATHHNVQSDSMDIGGPFDQKVTPVEGQKALVLKMAIGRKGDNLPPLKRSYGTVKCWTLTPAQVSALTVFLPWWCALRGIPCTACKDWRTFRLSAESGLKDPVTNVKGILAHTQISAPGARVDGILPLHHLLESGASIQWRTGAEFFNG